MKLFENICRNFNMRTKLILLLIPIIILPLAIASTIINIVFSQYMISSQTVNLSYANEKINARLQEYIEAVDKLSFSIISNDHVQNSLQENNENPLLLSQIISFLYLLKTNDIQSIIYMDNKGTVYNTDSYEQLSYEDIADSRIYNYLNGTSGKLIWCFGKNDISPKDESYYIFAARKVNNFNLSREPGILIIKIRLGKMNELFNIKHLKGSSHYLICDLTGNIIYDHDNMDNIGKSIQDENIIKVINDGKIGSYIGSIAKNKTLVTYNSNNSIDWCILGIIPYTKAVAQVRKVQDIILLITIVTIIIASIVAVWFSFGFTKPIKTLVQNMYLIRKGNFNVSINLNRKDEIGELALSFNKMSEEIEKLISKVREEQEYSKVAELNSLIHQINPHFLYNTLDNINMLAQMANEKRISELITSLSKLLRISLSKGSGIIPVRDELEHVRNYLIIQKMRHGSLFTFEICAQEDLLDKKVIKLILQPLVENSISHGFKNMRGGGLVNIRVFTEEGNVVFAVDDNGKGVSDEKLNMLNSVSGESTLSQHDRMSGYGIRNINSRLKLYYGVNQSVKFNINPQGGLTSKIAIPELLLVE